MDKVIFQNEEFKLVRQESEDTVYITAVHKDEHWELAWRENNEMFNLIEEMASNKEWKVYLGVFLSMTYRMSTTMYDKQLAEDFTKIFNDYLDRRIAQIDAAKEGGK